ncbi:Arc family DNA-binding protein [Klebsiella oxytoca]|uniref:Arc family DNA-binding protein n=1 Tax=Klebsiella oxytoca TaxID=571 RepID=UPI001CCD89A2|nr:Arc family DNA-binding protein [Klebsiella oxytoca]MCW9477452.1 Arc family DNA-binding protein [Klebsiella oxytoca]MCW9493726.1 Arc family DNA-binding protein [Klebsiella oxytoca]
MSEKPVRDYDKFMLRFPDGMRDAIAERAKRNGRSMNSEIVAIIDNAISQPALAQEGIEFILGLTEPGEIEKLSDKEKSRVHGVLLDAASIMAKNLETESYNLRRVLYLLSQDGPLLDINKSN